MKKSRIPEPPGPQDKIQVLTYLPALPGICVICKKSVDGATNFIDIGESLDYYGAFYFCEDCMRQVAYAIGFVEVKLLVESEQELEATRSALEEAEEELKNANTLIDSLRTFHPPVLRADSKLGPNSEPDYQGLEESDQVTERNDQGSTE